MTERKRIKLADKKRRYFREKNILKNNIPQSVGYGNRLTRKKPKPVEKKSITKAVKTKATRTRKTTKK